MDFKNYYITFLVCLFTLNSFSQFNFKIGANLGGQISSLRGLEFETDNNFLLVPSVGVNLEALFNDSWSVVTGINFEKWKKEREIDWYHSGSGGSYKSATKEGYSFFNIPLLLRYKLGAKKKYFVDLGGFMNYFNKGEPNGLLPLFINFEDYNFGLAFGGGMLFDLNDSFDLAIQIRNDLGFTDVNKYKTMLSGNVKTNTLRLIATLNYKL